MKLKPIFVNELTCEGLHSICLSGSKSEYEKLYDWLTDDREIRKFCIKNLHYLQSGFYGDITLEEVIKEIIEEVPIIFGRLLMENNYDKLFQRLNDNEVLIKELSLSKLKRTKKSKIRIYAIRISKDTYIVTGGAIKVVKRMKDHEDTIKEDQKLQKVRDWLREEGISIEDDLIYYYEQ